VSYSGMSSLSKQLHFSINNRLNNFEAAIYQSADTNGFRVSLTYNKILEYRTIVANSREYYDYIERLADDLSNEPMIARLKQIKVQIVRQYKVRPRRFTSSLPLRRGKL